jgi:hypothetical protein
MDMDKLLLFLRFFEYRYLHSSRNMIVWKMKAESGNLKPEMGNRGEKKAES